MLDPYHMRCNLLLLLYHGIWDMDQSGTLRYLQQSFCGIFALAFWIYDAIVIHIAYDAQLQRIRGYFWNLYNFVLLLVDFHILRCSRNKRHARGSHYQVLCCRSKSSGS
ncbi:unnamed protein product [Fraxinus pennsylvanica]|uniref:Uncharacterized protein n=1 Tax=Fraxinus pennsylvanica TaxID=56036 RepID=A0AAD2E463_9LAMI|nr:unnamed protein product [Fraxinus pennsylvanica]